MSRYQGCLAPANGMHQLPAVLHIQGPIVSFQAEPNHTLELSCVVEHALLPTPISERHLASHILPITQTHPTAANHPTQHYDPIDASGTAVTYA